MKMATDHTGGEDIVEVFEEAFLLHLLVSEDEGDALALLSSHAVQRLQILQQVSNVIRPTTIEIFV